MIESKTLSLYEELKGLLTDDFTRTVLEGSLRVLFDDNNPIRGNLFALGLREMVRYVLRARAPDESVRACPWYPLDEKIRGKVSKDDQVTDRDRMRYATQGGISDDVLQKLSIDPSEMHKQLKDTINSLSKYTHVQPNTVLGAAGDTDALANGVLETVLQFFDEIGSFRGKVEDGVLEIVDQHALDTFLESTFGELDELSSHTQVMSVTVKQHRVVNLDARTVTLRVRGTVFVTLQYGSSSDVRRGDGASVSDSYPFTMTVGVSTADISAMEVLDRKIDTSSFFEGRNTDGDELSTTIL